MRDLADLERLQRFMKILGEIAKFPGRVYLTGGSCAVLMGWRGSTIDVDMLLVPEQDPVLKALPEVKEKLQVNIEFACPADFIPELPDWERRSLFVRQEGKLAFYHYDFYAQALAKIERGHTQDEADVRSMLESGLVEPAKLQALYRQIETQLYRYPALDPKSFALRVNAWTEGKK